MRHAEEVVVEVRVGGRVLDVEMDAVRVDLIIVGDTDRARNVVGSHDGNGVTISVVGREDDREWDGSEFRRAVSVGSGSIGMDSNVVPSNRDIQNLD